MIPSDLESFASFRGRGRERGSLRARRVRLLPLGLSLALLFCGVIATTPAARAAEDADAVVEAITKTNKSALEEYDNLNFDVARKMLEEALELGIKSGLESHPITARTYFHLGVVILATGDSHRDEAIKQFQKALIIQPEIKPTERVANPEVQNAFNEAQEKAKAGGGGKGKAITAGETPGPGSPLGPGSPTGGGPAAEGAESAPLTGGLTHDPISSRPRGSTIAISVTTDPAQPVKKIVLWYRPDGAPKFLSTELREYSTGNWSASIPNSATGGDEVAYYLTAENEGGEGVGALASADSPMLIELKDAAAARARRNAPGDDADETARASSEDEPTWYLGLAAGSGFGWASGNGDVNTQDKVTSAFGMSRLGHVLPEVGYFVSRDMVLSLQFRYQLVSGATPVRDLSRTMCGADNVCDPATSAVAALVRMTWLFGEGTFVPFLSAYAGAGQIRHLATFPNATSCGADPRKNVKCVDTVSPGPIFVGPGAGFVLHATPGFGLTVGVTTLLGFPRFTLHVDFNAGIVVQI